MILLLDTTVLIDILRSRKNRPQQIARLSDEGHTLATSAINVAELYAGMRPNEVPITIALVSRLKHYDVTEDIARRAGRLKFEAAAQGRTFSLLDLLVAATALEHDVAVITENRKDFEIPGVRFYDLA